MDVFHRALSADVVNARAGASVIVQSFGNVEYHTAKFLSEGYGARITVGAERDGHVANPEGLSMEALKQHQIRTEASSALTTPYRLPAIRRHRAALRRSYSISESHQCRERIKALRVVEAANGPSPSKDKILRLGGVTILPDLYINAGEPDTHSIRSTGAAAAAAGCNQTIGDDRQGVPGRHLR
ncbi:hypothetical protein RWA01_33925 (plasmid) [Sinorhizobium meliloti]|uniref:hypothetical protein n=1 Tax=Rhizobium meliloti TaxID=382 RepID=UPI001F297FDD|nr:hypothetical protein [Sinorhizobium meliloti]